MQLRLNKYLILFATVIAAKNTTRSSTKQIRIRSELGSVWPNISNPDLIKDVKKNPQKLNPVLSSQQDIYTALKKESENDPPPHIRLSNTTELKYILEQCNTKTTQEISSDYDPKTKEDELTQKNVRYDDAREALFRLVKTVSEKVVPANLGQFIGIQKDNMDYTLLHELFENLGSTQRGLTFTVETTLTIIENLAPLMIDNNISLHTPDKYGKTPLELLTNHILEVNVPQSFKTLRLNFKSVLPIFTLMINLTPPNDPHFKTAIGNVFVESIRKPVREQELMNYIKTVVLDFKLDVNYKSPRREGMTRALEKAIRSDCDETVVKMLLQMGADPTLKDDYGRKPRDYVNKDSNKAELLRLAELSHKP